MPWFLIGLFFILSGGAAVAVINTNIPNTYDAHFKKYGAKYGVNWLLLKRIAMIESKIGTHPTVVRGLKNPSDIEGSKSTDGKSWGIMQVTLTTAQWLDPSATVEKLNNPDYSIDLAARYLKYLQGFFPLTDARYWEWVVKSYNQGQGNTAKERSGSSAGFAGAYWAKYKQYETEIVA
jgi:soluble lytic murein transglycosylase-like protein